MNSKVIYTSLTGGYDKLPQYSCIDPTFDYICFTNDYPEGTKQGIWTIRSIPPISTNNIVLSRYAKLNPHLVLQEYDYSVWLDSNLIITSSAPYLQINKSISDGVLWAGIVHPECDCIYEDGQRCIIAGKAKYKEIICQINFLKSQGYPQHFGLFENNFIIRNHNNETNKRICDMWWELYNTYSKRDQLSLFYIFWKLSFRPDTIYSKEFSTSNIQGINRITHIRKGFWQYNYMRIKRRIMTVYLKIFPII